MFTGRDMRQAARETASSSSTRQKNTKSTPKRVTPQQTHDEGILYLQQSHATFNAPSKRESVFFDECNREVISLTSGFEQTNRTRVVFQKTDESSRVEFLLPVEKRVLSIKLNSNRTVLAYHVERNIIEFVNVRETLKPSGQSEYSLDGKRYVQSSRAKNSKLIGFLWIAPTELVIITDLSVEYYQLNASRCRLALVKTFQSATNWFVYQPSIDSTHLKEPYSVLMVSTGSLGNVMQPYMFQGGRVVRLQKFEVEGNWQDSEKLELIERSITIASIYGHVRLLVLQHESLNVKSRGAQIVMYTIDAESGMTSKTHTLDLDVNGRFAINILDNLVIAHDQPSKASFIFDIKIKSTEKSDCPDHFVSLVDSRSIRPLTLKSGKPVELYSQNWVFFQPNFIVDAKLGLLTTINIDLEALQTVVQDNNLLLTFLAYRRGSEAIIMRKCKQIVGDALKLLSDHANQTQLSPLSEVSATFEILGKLAVSAPELATTEKTSGSGSFQEEPGGVSMLDDTIDEPAPASIYQEDIQREVFRDFDSEDLNDPTRYHFISSTYLEFIFALRRSGKNVEFCIYEQLLRCMLRAGKHFQIVQMIRSEIFRDSKQLACLLLSLKEEHRPARQLGLDMFHRLPGGLPANLPPELMAEN